MLVVSLPGADIIGLRPHDDADANTHADARADVVTFAVTVADAVRVDQSSLEIVLCRAGRTFWSCFTASLALSEQLALRDAPWRSLALTSAHLRSSPKLTDARSRMTKSGAKPF